MVDVGLYLLVHIVLSLQQYTKMDYYALFYEENFNLNGGTWH